MAAYINQENSDADKQVILRFPKGVDQVSAETALLPGAARRIVNFDVHQGAVGERGPAGGRLTRRSDVELAIAGTRTHSLWSGVNGTYFVGAGDLKCIHADMGVSVVRTGIGDDEMFYTEVADTVYFSNGTITGTVKAGAAAPWGLDVPASPVLTSLASGGLPAGRYMVSCTHMSATGQESGASVSSQVVVTDGGGIQLGLLASSLTTRVYVSPANGETLYWAQDMPAGATVAYIGAHQPGKALMTQHMLPPSAQKYLAAYNGRVYGAAGSVLLATQALSYELTRPSTDFVIMEHNISMVGDVTTGLYVGGARGVVFLEGAELKQFVLRVADALPPIPGSAMHVDGGLFGESGKGIVWLTQRGWVFGNSTGRIKRLTESQMALPAYERATSLYREHDGMRQVMTFVKGGGEGAGASDSYDVEIVRNGVVL